MLAKNPDMRWKASDLLRHKYFDLSDDYIDNESDVS